MGENTLPTVAVGDRSIFRPKGAFRKLTMAGNMDLSPSRHERGQVHVFGLHLRWRGQPSDRKMDQSPVQAFRYFCWGVPMQYR